MKNTCTGNNAYHQTWNGTHNAMTEVINLMTVY